MVLHLVELSVHVTCYADILYNNTCIGKMLREVLGMCEMKFDYNKRLNRVWWQVSEGHNFVLFVDSDIKRTKRGRSASQL